jgi:hypothetical protein
MRIVCVDVNGTANPNRINIDTFAFIPMTAKMVATYVYNDPEHPMAYSGSMVLCDLDRLTLQGLSNTYPQTDANGNYKKNNPRSAYDTCPFNAPVENIAAVNNGGEVVALNVGETVIKVTTDDGKKTASCKVKVIDRGVKFSQMEVLNVTSNSALIQGNIKPAGVEIEEKGLCYGIKQNSTLDDTKIQLKGDENSCQIGGLKAETTYYARFYAIVDGVVKYGDQLVFETLQPVDFVAPEFTDVEDAKEKLAKFSIENFEGYSVPRKIEVMDLLPRTKMEKIDFVKLSDFPPQG